MKELGKPQPDSDVVNEQPKVLLIGFGWVNQYLGKYFTEAHYVTSDGVIRTQLENEDAPQLIENCPRYNLAIISVPTPMNPQTGQCDVSIVEESVAKYSGIVDIFLVKSTVEIGTCERLEKEYGVSVCMSPELIGETLGHPMLEARKDMFQIIGGNSIAREAVARMFMKVLNANAPIYLVTHKEAEIIKYCENLWISERVMYWNNVFDICQAFNASFTSVREGLVLDPRMNRTHSNVYPNNRGFASKCVPKDPNALVYTMRKLGKPLRWVENLLEENYELRKKYKNHNKLLPDNPTWKNEKH